MTFLWHRIKAYLRKKHKITHLHILADEPQDNLSLHRHAIIFGISRIMDKREFTEWLDDKLIRFFSKMGDHVQKTVNNRLTEDQVKALNKLGKKLLKKYLRYKRKHKRYQGHINYLCKLVKKGNLWENPPPDYLKCLEKKKQQKDLTSYDGAVLSPPDYIRKYLIKKIDQYLHKGIQSS